MLMKDQLLLSLKILYLIQENILFKKQITFKDLLGLCNVECEEARDAEGR